MAKNLETKLRESASYWPKTADDLRNYIDSLLKKNHTYGSCVYAASLASIATFNYVATTLGMTGFQASCADMDFVARNRGMKNGFCILDYENLLYPQYRSRFDGITWDKLIEENREQLREQAKKKLATEKSHVDTRVREHWEMLAAS